MTLRSGLRALAALLGLAVAACDDAEKVTRVDALVTNLRSYIVPLAAGGLPVETHGAPFPGVTPSQVAARLRLPGGWPTDIAFREARPGDRGRLVLAFNPASAPDGYALCQGAVPALGPGGDIGFSVLATFCNGERVLVTGHLEAPAVRADDAEGFARAMTRLMQQMLT